METILLILTFSISSFTLCGQSDSQRAQIEQTCMNYINGFYTGDANLLKESLRPRLSKLGYWQNEDGSFKFQGYMSYEEALAFAEKVKTSGSFAKPDDPKGVEILDLGHTIAVVKITARWGIDYLTLSLEGDQWMIEQALWEGPLQRK